MRHTRNELEKLRHALADKQIDVTEEDEPFGRTTTIVLEYIIKGLSDGRYQPGQRLNAATLCSELGLSKAPVREALHVLAGEGVIAMVKNRGALIRDLSKDDLIQLWDVVSLNYGAEIRLAARNMDRPGAIVMVRKAMAGIVSERDRGPSMDFYKALHVLHNDVVAPLCDNPFMVSPQTRRLGEYWLPYISRVIPLETYIDRYVLNYQRITDALIAGDGATAESAFHYHAQWSAAIIRGDAPNPRGPWCADLHSRP